LIRPWQLLILLWIAFLFGPLRTSPLEDVPAEMIGESLLSGQGLDVAPYHDMGLPAEGTGAGARAERAPADATAVHGVLSLPFSAALRVLYPHEQPVRRARMAGRVAGAFFAAAAVAVTFAALARLVDPPLALLVCLGAAFASPLYSTASRSSSPAGVAALCMASIVWLALGPGAWRALGRGAAVAALYFLRPTSLLAPLALLATVGRGAHPRPDDGIRPLVLGATLAGVLLGLIDDAIAGRHRWGAPDLAAVAAYLVSPGRGLFVFAPVALLAVAGLARARGPTHHARLVRGCALAVAVALLEVAGLEQWWGGYGFGPHRLAAYIPLLALMAAFAPRRLVAWSPLLFVPAALLHAAFVFRGGHLWDERRGIDANPEVVWDLRDSAITDVFVGPPPPDTSGLDPARLLMPLGDHATAATPSAQAPAHGWFAHGWESPEESGVWAVGRETWLALALPGHGGYDLSLEASAPVVRGDPQRLEIDVLGERSAAHEFSRGLWEYETVRVPLSYRPGPVVVRFRPRHVWLPGKGDVRRCTFFVRRVRLERRTSPP